MGRDDFFDQIIQQSSILRNPKFLLPNGKPTAKRFIILNKNPTDNLIHFILATSQFHYYNKSPQWVKDQFVLIPTGVLPLFPLKTLINCVEVHTRTRAELKKDYQKRRLEKLGILPKQFLDKIIEIVAKSIFVEEEIKKTIL